ncbi:MAG: polysaccharide biosynthesis tyrosine autokinase [Pseudomonadota bacterium]
MGYESRLPGDEGGSDRRNLIEYAAPADKDAQEVDGGDSVSAIFRIILRRRFTIFLSFVLSAAAVLAYTLTRDPTYRATALVLISAQQEQVVTTQSVLSDVAPDASIIESQIELLKSRELIGKVIDRLDLMNDPYWAIPDEDLAPSNPLFFWRKAEEAPAAGRTSLASRIAPASSARLSAGVVAPTTAAIDETDAAIEGAAGLETDEAAAGDGEADQVVSEADVFADDDVATLDELDALGEAEALALPGLSAEEAEFFGLDGYGVQNDNRERIISKLQRIIAPRRRGISYVIEVAVDTGDPRQSQRLANTLVEVYLDSQIQTRFEATRRATAWLTDRVAELRIELQDKEAEVEAFRSSSGLLSTEGATFTAQQATDLQRSLIEARADLAEKEARYQNVAGRVRRGESTSSVAAAIDSPVIRELRGLEAEIIRRRADLLTRYGSLHPEVQKVNRERADIRTQIQTEIDRITEFYRNEVSIARSRLRALEDLVGGVQDQLAENNQDLIRLRELERETEAIRAVYESYLRRSREISESESLQLADGRLVERAALPTLPVSPKLGAALVVALTIGLCASLASAYAVDLMDDSIGSSIELRRRLGLRALSLVPSVKRSDFRKANVPNGDLLAFLREKPKSAFAESLRLLNTAIQHSHPRFDIRVVALTSTLPNEGKSSLTASLAASAVRSGMNVLVIDCDDRQRSMSTIFDITPATTGIRDVLAGRRNWREVIYETVLTDCHVLPCVGTLDLDGELLISRAMQDLLEEVRSEYDLVLLDCPPVLPVVESQVLAQMADAAILVVKWSSTPCASARSAKEKLLEADANLIGAVLNLVDPSLPGRLSKSDSIYYSGKYGGYYS